MKRTIAQLMLGLGLLAGGWTGAAQANPPIVIVTCHVHDFDTIIADLMQGRVKIYECYY